MAESNDPRFGIHRWSADSDTPSRDEFDNTFGALAASAVGYSEGLLANRPAPGKHGWIYATTDATADGGHVWYDLGSSWMDLTMIFGQMISASNPGDIEDPGATMMPADSGHVHAREPYGNVVALLKFGLAAGNGSGNALSRANHSHGTPAILNGAAGVAARSALSFVIPAPGAVSDDAANDRTVVTVAAPPIVIAHHIGNGLTVGVKKPRWIAPVNCTVLLARAMVDVGSGVTWQYVVNGAAAIPASTAVGAAVATDDFADFTLNAGDAVQVGIVNAGAGASDLSVTGYAIPR